MPVSPSAGLAVVVVQWVGTMRTPVNPSRASVGLYGLSGTNGTPHVLVVIGLAVTLTAAIAPWWSMRRPTAGPTTVHVPVPVAR